MILSCAMILVFTILMSIFAIKSRKIYPIIMKMIGIMLMTVSLVLFAAKMSFYNTNIPMEYDIYLFLNKMKITSSFVFTLSNIGVICFLISQIIYMKQIFSKKIIEYSIIPIVVFCFFNSKTICEKIYFYVADISKETITLTKVNDLVNAVMLAIFVAFIIAPYAVIVYSYLKTKILQRKKELLSSGVVWFIIDILGTFLIYGNKLDQGMFYNMSLLKYPNDLYVSSSKFSIFVFIIFLLITVYFVVKKLSPFGNISDIKNVDVLIGKDENTIMMLHSYKNAFCSILMCSDKKNNIGSEEERIDTIHEIAKDFSEKIEKTIQMYRANEKTLMAVKTQTNIVELVNDAVKRSKIDFPVEVRAVASNIEVNANAFQINECLICILNNAYEAIDYSKKDKNIDIEIGTENLYVYINITDNGCGVSKKNIQKIFKPLYSMKNGGNNFGMGLTYANKIAKSHGGGIRIKSKEGVYTMVQIVLNKNGK